MNLLKAIGANSNMSVEELKQKWDAAPASVKDQAKGVDDTLNAAIITIGLITTAMNALKTAQNAYDLAIRVSNPLNPAPAIAGTVLDTAKTEATKQVTSIADSSSAIISTMKSIEIKE